MNYFCDGFEKCVVLYSVGFLAKCCIAFFTCPGMVPLPATVAVQVPCVLLRHNKKLSTFERAVYKIGNMCRYTQRRQEPNVGPGPVKM